MSKTRESRTASLVLLLMGLVLAMVSFTNYYINITPQYDHLSYTIEILERAQTETVFERKIDLINQSLITYTQGVSQQNLQALKTLSLSTIAETDYWLPKIIGEIKGERDGHLFSTPILTMAGLQFCFVVAAGIGTFCDYESWSINERHTYIAVLAVLIVGIILLFL